MGEEVSHLYLDLQLEKIQINEIFIMQLGYEGSVWESLITIGASGPQGPNSDTGETGVTGPPWLSLLGAYFTLEQELHMQKKPKMRGVARKSMPSSQKTSKRSGPSNLMVSCLACFKVFEVMKPSDILCYKCHEQAVLKFNARFLDNDPYSPMISPRSVNMARVICQPKNI